VAYTGFLIRARTTGIQSKVWGTCPGHLGQAFHRIAVRGRNHRTSAANDIKLVLFYLFSIICFSFDGIGGMAPISLG